MQKLLILILSFSIFTITAHSQGVGGFFKRALERKAVDVLSKKIDKVLSTDSSKNNTGENNGGVFSKRAKGLGKITTDAKPDNYYKFTSSFESSLSTRTRTKGRWIKSNQKMYINSGMPVLGMRQEMQSGSASSKDDETFSVFDFQKDAVFNFSKFDDVKMVMAVNLDLIGGAIASETPQDKILHWKKLPQTKMIADYLCDGYLIELSNGIMELFVSRNEIPGFDGFVRNMQRSSKQNNSGWSLLFSLQKSNEISFKEGQMVMAYDWTGGRGAKTIMTVTKVNKEDAFEFDTSEYRKP